jgi:integrative and conjugative element protein (TIGR02256 family)
MRDVKAPALWVHEEVLGDLTHLPGRPWEVGGWLLGYWRADGNALVLTHATPPGRRGTPFGVTVDADRHRPMFDDAWDASEGQVTFLGDWHTHPGGPPFPSARDRRALEQLAKEPEYQTDTPLIAIVANPRWPWRETPRDPRFFLKLDDQDPVLVEPRPFSALPPEATNVPRWTWPRKESDDVHAKDLRP